jgi:hypothetical protein
MNAASAGPNTPYVETIGTNGATWSRISVLLLAASLTAASTTTSVAAPPDLRLVADTIVDTDALNFERGESSPLRVLDFEW